jgi:hypothetical protein
MLNIGSFRALSLDFIWLCVHVGLSKLADGVIRFGHVHRDRAEPDLAARSAAAGGLPRRERPVAKRPLANLSKLRGDIVDGLAV